MTSSTPLNKRSVSRSLSLLPRRLFSLPLSRPLSPRFSLALPPSTILHLPHSTRTGMQQRAVSRTQRPDCRTPGEICQSPPITGISLPSLHFYAVFAASSRSDGLDEGGEHGEREGRKGKKRGTRGNERRWKCIEIRETM